MKTVLLFLLCSNVKQYKSADIANSMYLKRNWIKFSPFTAHDVPVFPESEEDVFYGDVVEEGVLGVVEVRVRQPDGVSVVVI